MATERSGEQPTTALADQPDLPMQSKFSPERCQRAIEAIRLGATRQIAAKAAGIRVETLYAWLRRGRTSDAPEHEGHRQFVRDLEAAEAADAVEMLERVREAAAEPRNWGAAAWLLERRHGYVRREQVEHSGEQTHRVIAIPAQAATPQEWAAQQATVDEPERISGGGVDSVRE